MSPRRSIRRRGPARRSALIVGTIEHHRFAPRPNAFRYGAYWALIDVDELPALDREVPGFGYRRPAITSFHDTDHLGPDDRPVRRKLADWLATQDLSLPPGRVEVLTNLRVLGHVFNPVSWWFCRDEHDRVVTVVAEVNNTFGGSHLYVLDQLEHDADGTLRARLPKAFHVSPFLGIEGHEYRFVFRPPGERTSIDVEVRAAPAAAEGRILTASQRGRRRPLTGRDLAATLVTYPLVTLRTVYLIHRQALRLWRLRTPFHRTPVPPLDPVSRTDPADARTARVPQGPATAPAEELVP